MKKNKRHNKIITVIATTLAISLSFSSANIDKITAAADNVGTKSNNQVASLAGPYIDQASGETMYNYVYSGSYPQSEVASDKLTDAIKNAVYSEDGISDVNGEKYKKQVKKYATSDYDTVGYYRYEPIKWRILENDGSNLVLQASTALDCEVFSGGTGDYSSSDLRNYLNTTFLNMAFSGDEQKGLLNADENGDKVTVLSKEEVKKYLPADKSREMSGTDFSAAKGNYVYDLYGGSNIEWWTRSVEDNKSVYISNSGQIEERECEYSRNAIVPVIKLAISELYYSSEYKTTHEPAYDSENGVVKWQIVSFGSYPQKDVTDSVADIASGNFDENGDAVISGKKYHRIRVSGLYRYYEYEPIKWRIIEENNNEMKLQCFSVIDGYALSDGNAEKLFEWLNSDFLKMAFNGISSVICGESEKVTLLDDNEIENENYGFRSFEQKKASYTDYAKGKGVYCNEKSDAASYWIKSSENDKEMSGYADTDGVSVFSLLNGNRGIVPVITIKKVPYIWNMSQEVSSYVPGKDDTPQVTETPEPKVTPVPDDNVSNPTPTPQVNAQKVQFEQSKPAITKISNCSAIQQKVSWKAVSGASSYEVYVKVSKTGKYSLLLSTKKTSALSSHLKKGHKYYYIVRAKAVFDKTECVSRLSDAAEKMTWNAQKPKIDISLKKTKNKCYVMIRWNNVSDATHIQLYRAMPGKKFSKLLDTRLNAQYKKGAVISYKYSTGKFKFKVRSYNYIKKKKVYSKYSKVHTVSLR